jgi:hypothetical protein
MRRFVAAFALLVPFFALNAQRRRPESSQPAETPKWWGSASIGYLVGDLIHDAATTSSWDFDTGFAWRVSLERSLAPLFSAGIAWSTSRLPLSYTSQGTCTRCQADANVSTFAAVGRLMTSPRRLHQVVELNLGVVRYDAFERVSPKQELQPHDGNTDFMIGAAGGLGFALARDWQIALLQDWNMSFHERPPDGVGGGRTSRTYTSRMSLRVGF